MCILRLRKNTGHMHSIINWLLLIAFVNLSLFIENSTLVQRRSLLSLALSPDSKHNHLKSDSKVFYQIYNHIQNIIISQIQNLIENSQKSTSHWSTSKFNFSESTFFIVFSIFKWQVSPTIKLK